MGIGAAGMAGYMSAQGQKGTNKRDSHKKVGFAFCWLFRRE
jgi:hypothetical protein